MTFFIRFVHVGAASFLFGGAALIFVFVLLNRGDRASNSNASLMRLLTAYEWAFWLCAALLAITGIGNLAAFHSALPGPETDWGGTLLIKLSVVLVLLVLSGVRSSCLVLARRTPDLRQPALEGLYGATAVFVVAIAGLAISLAHF
jgi:putative copper export protein